MIGILNFSSNSLTIYDGNSTTSPMLGQYCGSLVPPTQFSSTNELLFHFQTSPSVGSGQANTYDGFKLEYKPSSK